MEISTISETLREKILYFCNYQERCQKEVRNKLFELGCNKEEVDELMIELISSGTVNEERFARAFSRGKFRMKQWGRVKIKYELRIRGISEYCIRKGLSEIDTDEYAKVITKLVSAKKKGLRGEKNIERGKIYRYLVQKGFEQDIVGEELKKADFI